jgi:hypothetical protein
VPFGAIGHTGVGAGAGGAGAVRRRELPSRAE